VRRPVFIAEQARNAKGPLGRVIAFIMARETWSDNLAAIDALDLKPTDHVLDIGCGHGRALGELARRAPLGRVVGVDPSELMTEIAVDRNRSLVRAKRVDVAQAGVEELPFEDRTFDKAMCVHGIYFWSDIDAALKEINRVLKPGGRAVFLFRSSTNVAAAEFPLEVYKFPSLHELVGAMTDLGLDCRVERQELRSSVVLSAERGCA
jgi:ubiquinone/menaquinone biosynthesis C-methylase UbiE